LVGLFALAAVWLGCEVTRRLPVRRVSLAAGLLFLAVGAWMRIGNG
jgi:putative Ca2+/H+ antiporter (TMEM165/GDT1 family)